MASIVKAVDCPGLTGLRGRRSVAAMGTTPPSSSAGTRTQETKRPVVAVRVIVQDAAERVLIIRRADGRWCLPGGKVDYGQTIEQAVAAELREETGLECTGQRFLFYQDSLPLQVGAMHCINLYFECRASGQPRTTEEALEFAWIGPTEIERYEITFRNDVGLQRFWQGS